MDKYYDVADCVRADGYAVVEGVLTTAQTDTLAAELAQVDDPTQVRRRTARGSGVYAIRNLLDVPAVSALSGTSIVRNWIEPVLGPEAMAVRAVLFDKTDGANWTVPWHQDVAIAVDRRVESVGYTAWSVKAGVTHVHPPAAILERMLSIRIHLDDCGPENGPLEVIPGSHAHGRLSDDEFNDWTTRPPVACIVDAGGIVLMRPLTLHRSLSARNLNHRRVIHIDYANAELPDGLRWNMAPPHDVASR